MGALGDAATFSFFPSKNLPCLGDGGAITTNSDEVAATARKLRFHGSADKQTFEAVGYNSRLDEMQAAVLRVLLKELDGWNDARRAAAAAYERHGVRSGVRLHARLGAPPVRDRARARRRAGGRAGGARHPGARLLPRARPPPAGDGRVRDGAELPATDDLARTNLALPMGTQLAEEQVEEVVAALRDALA